MLESFPLIFPVYGLLQLHVCNTGAVLLKSGKLRIYHFSAVFNLYLVCFISRQPEIDKSVRLGFKRLVYHYIAIHVFNVHLKLFFHQFSLTTCQAMIGSRMSRIDVRSDRNKKILFSQIINCFCSILFHNQLILKDDG